jgi:hypothetical protein
MAKEKLSYCSIYPGIGIARLGNSPSEFFIGLEAPPAVPGSSGRLQRTLPAGSSGRPAGSGSSPSMPTGRFSGS